MADVQLDVPTIVIPYRNRQDHLDCVLARFKRFPVIVVEQCDTHLFNRGALLNAGYIKARQDGAYRVILHDCDLVPDDTLLQMYQEHWPRPVVHFGARFKRYNNCKHYFGGVHGFTAGHFPGFPNKFWGWGGEDDALRKRVDLHNTTYAKHGEYCDLEGYSSAKEKLRHLPPQQRCQTKYELLAADTQATDNHHHGTPHATIHWSQQNALVTWGCITFRHTA